MTKPNPRPIRDRPIPIVSPKPVRGSGRARIPRGFFDDEVVDRTLKRRRDRFSLLMWFGIPIWLFVSINNPYALVPGLLVLWFLGSFVA